MTDEELEEWIGKRVEAIRSRLRRNFLEHPEHFWREIDSVVLHIVEGCVELEDFDWPDNLYLGDVIDKHIIRPLSFLIQEKEKKDA